MQHTDFPEDVNRTPTVRKKNRAKKAGVCERVPPLRIRHWSNVTATLSLEQRGLLVEMLDWAWATQQELPHPVWGLGRAVNADKRQIRRLWTDEVQKAFDVLSVGRRPIDDFTRQKVWEKTGGCCSYCDVELVDDGERGPDSFHVDHVAPVAGGGRSHIDNLVPSCARCNLRKGVHHG